MCLIPGLVLLLGCLAPLRAQDHSPAPFVKVRLNRLYVGVVHEDRYLSQVHVEEITELQGVAVDSQGYLVCYVGSYGPELTVSGNGVQLEIETDDGKTGSATLVGVDERIALAVLRADLQETGVARLGSDVADGRSQFISLQRGSWERFGSASLEIKPTFPPYYEVQVAAPWKKAEPCVSEGGFVLGPDRHLLGIVTHTHPHPFSRKLQIWEVLPAAVVKESLGRILKSRKDIRAGWLGIVPEARDSGMAIDRVLAATPAARAGLQPDDVILSVEGLQVRTHRDLARAIQWKGAGGNLKLAISRAGRVHQLAAVLEARPDRQPEVSYRLELPPRWTDEGKPEELVRIYRTVRPPLLRLGLVVDPLTPQLAKFFRCPKEQGLLIKSVLPDSLAQQVGFQAGDVLTQIDDRELSSHQDIEESLREVEQGAVLFQFVRDGQVLSRRITFQ